MAALFFLAFAFFAVGQAAVIRNTAQTAADSAALAAARADRNAVRDDFLAALTSGDLVRLGHLLGDLGTHSPEACAAAAQYAADNDASLEAGGCNAVSGPPGYTISVTSLGTVGRSVVDGTEAKKAHATATAVIQPRCRLSGDDGNTGGVDGGAGGGGAERTDPITFACQDGEVTIDPAAAGFELDLSTFYTVHLSK